MSDYEHIVVSAVRYALGRMTYMVKLTVDYVLNDIEEKKLGDKCLWIIKSDIQHSRDLGMECDEKEWHRLVMKTLKQMIMSIQ